MLFFFDANLVFLSTPKTGSTAYHAILKCHADIVFSGTPKFKHITARHFDRHIAPYLKKTHGIVPERVAVIRDPLEHLGSWYRYRQRLDAKKKPTSTVGISYGQFVEAYLSSNRPQFAKVSRQFKFVTSGKSQIRVHHLFAYENPEVQKAFLEKRLGFDCSTNQVNVSPKKELSLEAGTERRLRDFLAEDIELYQRIVKAGGHLESAVA